MIKSYYRILNPALCLLNARPSASLAAISAGAVSYFGLLIHQLRTFDGSLRDSSFLAAPTVVPWFVYALAGTFVAPFLIGRLYTRIEPKGHAPAVLTSLLLGLWFVAPLLVLQYASWYGTGPIR